MIQAFNGSPLMLRLDVKCFCMVCINGDQNIIKLILFYEKYKKLKPDFSKMSN